MSLKNSEHHYGWLAVVLHWLVAAVVVGLFALGFWMVDLSYYDEWYRKGPDLHRSIGLILFAVVVFRLLWRLINASPRPLAKPQALGSRLGPRGPQPAVRADVCGDGQWLLDYHGRRFIDQCLRLV